VGERPERRDLEASGWCSEGRATGWRKAGTAGIAESDSLALGWRVLGFAFRVLVFGTCV
jgi:hypothetical protein